MAIVPRYDQLEHGNRDASDEADIPERRSFFALRPHRPSDVFDCRHEPRYVLRIGDTESCLVCRGERQAVQ